MMIFDSLKDNLRRWRHDPASKGVSPTYSYRIFWVKEALRWTEQERRQIRAAVEKIVGANDFVANAYHRRYRLEPFDGQKHAGESISVLHDVLAELDRYDKQEDLHDDGSR